MKSHLFSTGSNISNKSMYWTIYSAAEVLPHNNQSTGCFYMTGDMPWQQWRNAI